MSKYIAITTDTVSIGDGYDSTIMAVNKIHYFDSDSELIAWYENWDNKSKNPIIYALAGRVKMKEQLTISLSES